MRHRAWLAGIATVAMLGAASVCRGERVKDIVDVKGVRGNPVWGYGLVVGLNGSGDDSVSSRHAMASILRKAGLTLSPAELASKNIASVLVTAELPPFARSGGKIDVTVSAIGNCTSLQGGTLLMTELLAVDGVAYAVAAGNLSVGGIGATGTSATATKNHPTVGRIPGGGSIEKDEVSTLAQDGAVTLQLKNPDFTTAEALVKAINAVYPGSATATDASSVKTVIPKSVPPQGLTAFIDRIGSLTVAVDVSAMVVIDSRNGTIVVGQNVSISPVAIAHGNLSIVTQEKQSVSQPMPFSQTGRTEKTNSTEIDIVEERGALNVVSHKVSVSELARALNALGLTPRDLITIFEALRQAGALQAELKVI